MARRSVEQPTLSAAQLEIMSIVWEAQPVTVAEVWRRLSALRPVARNTVQTMMKRLADKGWLRHSRRRNAFVYTAAIGRTKTVGSILTSVVNAAFAGSSEKLVMALLDTRDVSSDELARIRKMIDDAAADLEP